MLAYLQLPEDLIGQQLLPQVVSTLHDDRKQAPVHQVTVGRRLPDPPNAHTHTPSVHTSVHSDAQLMPTAPT